MTRFLLMCPAAVLLTLSPESAVALRMSRAKQGPCDGEGCGFAAFFSPPGGRGAPDNGPSALPQWQMCAEELSKQDVVPLLQNLGEAHRKFAGAAGSDVLVVQDFNQRVKDRYALTNFFFPSQEKKNDYNQALANDTVGNWMKNECDTVTPAAYALQQRTHAAEHADWRSNRFFEGGFLPPHGAKQQDPLPGDFKEQQRKFDTSTSAVREKAGFLPLFDFHLYRSLVCSNKSGKALKEIFGKDDVDNRDATEESEEEQKTKALSDVLVKSEADLVFTQEYHEIYNEVLSEHGYANTGAKDTTLVHWKTSKLHCNNVEENIDKKFGSAGKVIWTKMSDKFNFVECEHVVGSAKNQKKFLAVSYHGPSNAKLSGEQLFPSLPKDVGEDQLGVLNVLLTEVERAGTYSSIIVGADANQEMKATTTGTSWNSHSAAVWTSSHPGKEWQTCEKQRSFLQHQWKKVEKPDQQGKDHVLARGNANTVASVDVVYGFDYGRELRVRGNTDLPPLPSAEWPFDHAAVKATVDLADAPNVIVLQQNLGGNTIVDKVEMSSLVDTSERQTVDKVEMSSLVDTSEHDSEILFVRRKMDLYMALYGWPHMLVTMQNSDEFASWRSSNVGTSSQKVSDLSQNFLSGLGAKVDNKCRPFDVALTKEVIPTGDILGATDFIKLCEYRIRDFWKNVFGF
jgi:hypothetical protein